MSPLNRRLTLFLVVLLSWPAMGTVDLHQFDTESQRQRYLVLSEELRCPKCQNQNLAGSNSQIATDLRRELLRLLSEGKTDVEIKAFMVARYGDFVLYKPPLTSSTYVLWFLPLFMIVAGLIVLTLIIRQRRKKAVIDMPLSEEERAKLDSLVKTNSENVDL